MLEVVRELKNINVDVYFEKENIHSLSGKGELMLTILASFPQEGSRSVSENCKWRIRKRFEQGELINLRFLYGYRIEKGKVKIHEEEAEIVKIIFDDYLSGMGCTVIAKKLRERNIKKLRDGKCNSEKVADIIKNEKYKGLVNKYEEVKSRIEEIELKINKQNEERNNIKGFIERLDKYDGIIIYFDEGLVNSVIDVIVK